MMAKFDFSGIEKLAEEAVLRGAQRGIAKVAKMLGGSGPSEDEKPAKVPTRLKRSPETNGEKRSPKDLADLSAKIHAYIEANPGQGVEHIGKALGITTDEIKLPVRKMVSAGQLKTKGQKRATRYFAA